jgi:hypothetical protein
MRGCAGGLRVMLLLLALASCSGAPAQPTRDWIELKSIQPAEGSALGAGEQVSFTATVDCTIATSGGGSVAMIVQAPGVINEPKPVPLPKGTRTVTLASTAVMPESGTPVIVFLPLWVNDSNVTAMMKRVSYSVR